MSLSVEFGGEEIEIKEEKGNKKKKGMDMGTGHCIEMFNSLLSDLKVFEQNLQGLHWLIKGPNFFALHQIYGDMYDAAGVEVDEVAEKIRAMGGEPVHCFDCFLGHAEMKVIMGESNDVRGVTKLLECIDYLVKKETELAVMLESHVEKGIPEFVYGGVDMLGKMLNGLEKMRWQLSMFIGEEVKVEKGGKENDMEGSEGY